MRIAILGATGQTGRELTRQALDRGHQVTVLARDPARVTTIHPGLKVTTADIHDPSSIASALADVELLLSGLGTGPADTPDTLGRGAVAAVASGVQRIIWLGALGTGASRRVAGPLLGPLLALALRSEIPDKVRADTHIAGAGHTVVHAGRLTNHAGTSNYRLVSTAAAGRLWFPPSIARADVATLMLDEAEHPHFVGQTAVTLRS
jgi:putative NADH-flavin reductase